MKTARYFIYLSYKGTSYSGWQVQPGELTVQGVLEDALSTLLQENIKLVGAGRTDTGVHASVFVAHFDSTKLAGISGDLSFKLNSFLPKDIAINKIVAVKAEAHARFDALSRTYKYYITRVKNPFNDKRYTYLSTDLDVDKMNSAAAYLLEYKDFTSFSKLHTDVKTNICKVDFARWIESDEKLVFEIRADRFLRNMVRAIVGTLLDIGRGKIPPEEIKRIIEKKDRSKAGRSVEADGLYLSMISYPDSLFDLD